MGGGGVYKKCFEGRKLKISVDQMRKPCTQALLVLSVKNKQRDVLQVVVVAEEEVVEGGSVGCIKVEFKVEELYLGEETRLGEEIEERRECARGSLVSGIRGFEGGSGRRVRVCERIPFFLGHGPKPVSDPVMS